ncbi:type 2 lanthipeptide synthetase LanM [Sphingomonas sp. ERG5]|uniref:type 2 lanthipeptide synthetase LanM n=1 Tax=Sphingomonas sp. ERG5 TaxID=1381597 RepID=UPI0009E06228|nr:type 2 lanthipeptide synthetase LanM [Sphingomonas sp. ERG5]
MPDMMTQAPTLSVSARPASVLPGVDPAMPLPFEHVLAPLVGRTVDALLATLGQVHPAFAERLSPAVTGMIERTLLHRLVSCSVPMLLGAFNDCRPPGFTLLSRFLDGEVRAANPEEGASRIRYDGFVADMLAGGFERLRLSHPVFAHVLDTETRHFHDHLVEAAGRLLSDLPAIVLMLGGEGDPGAIRSLHLTLSDPHRNGRAVMIFAFESGLSIVYKPRDLELDAAFHAFWQRCEPSATRPAFLLCGDYGWMEAVAPVAPATPAEQQQLDIASGRLLAVLYLLGATDCHFENFIVRGGELVMIDAETALHPALSGTPVDRAHLGDPWDWDSVMRPGLLPYWIHAPEGDGACDVSALGWRGAVRGNFARQRWRALNTDAMTLASEPVTPDAEISDSPEIDLDALSEGFAAMYRRLVERRDALRQSAELRALGTARARFVLRGTMQYGTMLQKSLVPHCLESFAAYRAHFEQLPVLVDAADPHWMRLRDAEIAALERRDIPYFTVDTSGVTVTACDGTTVDAPGLRCAYPDMLERFDRLGAPDLARQITLIGASVAAARTRRGTVDGDRAPVPIPGPGDRSDELMRAALDIADRIVASAHGLDQGRAQWIGLHYYKAADCYAPQRLGHGLYEGNAGIALFLAAGAALGGRDDLRNAAHAALAPIRTFDLRASDAGTGRITGIGAGAGLGALVYALTRCADLLGDDALLSDATRIAGDIDDAAIAADTHADILYGTAGAIVSLLALHQRTGASDLIDRAAAAGRRLTQQWTEVARAPGMSHGAAGFALALARLSHATGDAAFGRTAGEAIAFERSLFDVAAGNWPDLRFPPEPETGRPPCSMMWCHGAPGIGVSRLAMLDLHVDQQVLEEVETAIAATLGNGIGPIDHLCCGNFGRLDFLSEAGQVLDRPLLHAQAIAMAQVRLEHQRETGSFALDVNDGPDHLKPGLFSGLAGVGYTLLRLAAPGRLPTVLTWN